MITRGKTEANIKSALQIALSGGKVWIPCSTVEERDRIEARVRELPGWRPDLDLFVIYDPPVARRVR